MPFVSFDNYFLFVEIHNDSVGWRLQNAKVVTRDLTSEGDLQFYEEVSGLGVYFFLSYCFTHILQLSVDFFFLGADVFAPAQPKTIVIANYRFYIVQFKSI
ncbi:hypothetical protein R6Q59_006694 [Mikania micrantha]